MYVRTYEGRERSWRKHLESLVETFGNSFSLSSELEREEGNKMRGKRKLPTLSRGGIRQFRKSFLLDITDSRHFRL